MVNSHWMSAVIGLHYLKNGLESFCDEVVTKQHKHFMPDYNRSCNECKLDTLKPNHISIPEKNKKNLCPLGQRNCNCLKSAQTLKQCPKETCGVIYDKIIIYHGSTSPSPNWMNTDIEQWYSNPWAIATCFINADGYRGRTKASEFDCSGLLSVIINNKVFLGHLDCNIDGKDPFSQAREIRNELFHLPSQKLEETEAQRYISVMIGALQDGKELRKRKESCLAVENLTDLVKMRFTMYQHIEMVQKVQLLSEKITSLQLEMQNLRERRTETHISGTSDEEFLKGTGVLQSLVSDLQINERKEGYTDRAIENTQINSDVFKAVESGDLSRAISLLTLWVENLCSLKQRHSRQTADFKMPTLRRPHDGRLITLTKEDVRGILTNCNDVLKGGFGVAYASSMKVPDLDLRVVIKRIVVEGEEEMKMLSVSNEKIASRVMHYAIVPLIAYMDEILGQNKRAFYFLSPYLEKGNLLDVIASDKQCSDIEDVQLKHRRRIEILYQIASALEYLHTPVPDYRGIVLHMDLTSTNIVLDSFLNARIIDFGLAREMKEGQTKVTYTQSKCLGTPGYYPTTRYSKLTVHEDYYNFGVVIREVLTGEAPYIKDGNCCSELRKFPWKLINKKLQSNVWEGSTYVKVLVSLSTECLESREKNLTAAKIVKRLEMMHTLRTHFTRQDEDKCHICMVNFAVSGAHSPQHECIMKVCVSCLRNSHINPIKCPICNKDVKPKTGHTTAALLIAGNDTKDAMFANSLTNEIQEIKGVLLSKYPCVIGCREENVRIVAPSNPGKPEQLLSYLSSEINYLKSRRDLETLLLYFTGHHFPASGFHLGGPEEILTLNYLKEALKQISEEWKNETRILVFLDCCHPPSVAQSIQDPTRVSLKIIQLNACRSCETSYQPQSGSTFQKFFIQALTRRSFNKLCHNTTTENECKDCEMTGDFISIEKLLKYISDHMRNRWNGKQPVTYTSGITWLDASIGYNVDFVNNYEFKFGERSKHVTLPHRIFYDIIELKKTILKNVIDTADHDEQPKEKLAPVEFSDAIALRIHTGSEDGQELHSMLNVSSAMNGKREIVASYRTVSNILHGPVVLFVPTDRIIQYLDDKNLLKHRDESRKIVTFSIGEFDIVTDEIAKISDLAEIHRCLLKVYEKWTDEKDEESKELTVIFPCIKDDNFQDIMLLDLSTKPDTSPTLKKRRTV